MKDVSTAALFSEPHAVRPKHLGAGFAEVDGVTWQVRAVSDGLAYSAFCACGGRMLTGIERCKPSALRCSKCGAWHRLP